MYKSEEIGPCILLINNAIENTEEIIEKALDKSKFSGVDDAKVRDLSGLDIEEKGHRNTKSIDISANFSNDVFWWLLAQKIWKFADDYGNKYKVTFFNMEPLQFLWYKKDEGFYSSHVDSDRSNPRIFSCVLYLNDVDEGGETYFENFDISVKPKKGSMILFPANYSYIHGANVPISNDKFAIVTWFNP